MGGEITSIFGLDVWHVADGVRTADYISGTVGLSFAIKMACWKLDMMWLYDYYDQMPWYDSDQFDSIMQDRAFYAIVEGYKPGCTNAYYLHLATGKEWGDGIC